MTEWDLAYMRREVPPAPVVREPLTKEHILGAARMALDALADCTDEPVRPRAYRTAQNAITALREALAAPMPEPVAWLWLDQDGYTTIQTVKPYHDAEPLYAAPPAAPEECDMADDGGCPVCGEDGGTSCGMPNCGLLQGAAPVVQEPLTEEQIGQLRLQIRDLGYVAAYKLTRAVEQAHGIGGGK